MCFGDEEQPSAPAYIQPPAPPSASDLASAAAQAQVDAFGNLIPLLPQYAGAMAGINQQYAPQYAQTAYDIQAQFAPQYTQLMTEMLKSADPTGYALKEQLGQQIMSNLALGGALTPEQQRQFEQDIRAGQVSRGGGTSLGETFDEAVYLAAQRLNQEQQRISNAASYLGLPTPQSSFSQLPQAPSGSPDVSSFASGLFPSTNSLIGAGQNAYGQQAANTAAMNAYNQSNYQFGVQNQPQNPFLTGLGVVGGLAGNAAPFFI